MTLSNTNNIGSINLNSEASTQNFFNNTNLPPTTVSQNIDDAVIGYFQQVAENKESAKSLAAAVILTSISQGIDPMETLEEFSRMGKEKLNSYLTMFLNLNRVGTSYLGLSNRPATNKYVARMILP
jgi:hypothetical protein